jgi:hypothetical protein
MHECLLGRLAHVYGLDPWQVSDQFLTGRTPGCLLEDAPRVLSWRNADERSTLREHTTTNVVGYISNSEHVSHAG